MKAESKNYTTRASAHGMAYMPIEPKIFNMTLAEAEADVRFWRAYADTVGGDAIIVKRPTAHNIFLLSAFCFLLSALC